MRRFIVALVVGTILLGGSLLANHFGPTQTEVTGWFAVSMVVTEHQRSGVDLLLTLIGFGTMAMMFSISRGFAPLVIVSGAFANTLELLLFGRVTDFLVLGVGPILGILSLGDVCIFSGYGFWILSLIQKRKEISTIKKALSI